MDPKPFVLIIEDDSGIAELLSTALEMDGYRVGTTEGLAGVDAAKRLQPAVIVLDLHMWPVDGEQVWDALHADPATAPIPVLLCSALPNTSAVAERLQAPFLRKPFSLDLLQETLARLIATPAPITAKLSLDEYDTARQEAR